MSAKLTIAGLLLAAVAVGFYWYSQRGMKLPETHSILIGEFSNPAGDPVFDGTLREALGVSLAQSPSLNLVSVEKVPEALRSMGRPVDSLLLPGREDRPQPPPARVTPRLYLLRRFSC
jgi:hypothetical protein